MTDQATYAAAAPRASSPAPAAAAADAPGVGASAPRRAGHAAETLRLYASDWAAFAAWCHDGRHAALPAAPATVAAYLVSLSTTLTHGALARRAAAIADLHRRGGHASPGTDPAVRAVLRAAWAARRAARPPPRGGDDAPPARPPPAPPSAVVPRAGVQGTLSGSPFAQLARMAARCPGDLAGQRDRALLLLTAAGLGGERLLALDREHVRFTGSEVELALSGTGDGAGEGVAIARIPGSAACPVRALEDWLRSSDTRFGAVFRKVDRWGNVEHRRLRADALRRIWQRRATALRPARRTETEAVTAAGPPAGQADP